MRKSKKVALVASAMLCVSASAAPQTPSIAAAFSSLFAQLLGTEGTGGETIKGTEGTGGQTTKGTDGTGGHTTRGTEGTG